MKDIILSDSPEELEATSLKVDVLESQILDLLQIVRSNFLGDPDEIIEIEMAFTSWKPIRDSVISLKKAGASNEAELLSRNESAILVENLNNLLNEIDIFAHNKASEFLETGIKEQERARNKSIYFLSFSMLFGVVIALFGTFKLTADTKKLQKFAISEALHAEAINTSLLKTVRAFALAVESRDAYTAGHMSRVAELAVAIARKLRVAERDIDGIKLGASIHDLGKIAIPTEILSRPGNISAAEFEVIKAHSQIGYDIIKDIYFPWPIAEMVLYHHERLDGSGYPAGLKGNEIPFEAQLLAVADVVEAISSNRPYRKSLGMEAALQVIKDGSGSKFSPEIVDVCLELIKKDGFAFSGAS